MADRGWNRRDAVTRICDIIEKLPREEWWPTIRLVNKWASLGRKQEEIVEHRNRKT